VIRLKKLTKAGNNPNEMK